MSVASATCYTTDPAPLDRFISGVDGHQAMTMLHLYDDRSCTRSCRSPRRRRSAATRATYVAQVEALSPEERREILSRKDSPFYTGETPPNV